MSNCIYIYPELSLANKIYFTFEEMFIFQEKPHSLKGFHLVLISVKGRVASMSA